MKLRAGIIKDGEEEGDGQVLYFFMAVLSTASPMEIGATIWHRPAEPGWTDLPHVYHLQFLRVDPLRPLQQCRRCNVGDYV